MLERFMNGEWAVGQSNIPGHIPSFFSHFCVSLFPTLFVNKFGTETQKSHPRLEVEPQDVPELGRRLVWMTIGHVPEFAWFQNWRNIQKNWLNNRSNTIDSHAKSFTALNQVNVQNRKWSQQQHVTLGISLEPAWPISRTFRKSRPVNFQTTPPCSQ